KLVSVAATVVAKFIGQIILPGRARLLMSAATLFLLASNAFAGKPGGAPAAPSYLAATAVSSSQINLTWQDNAGNETGFKIERAPTASGTWVQIATVGASVTTYANTGLNASTTYYYRVRAYAGKQNSSYAGVASATTLGVACTVSITPSSASFNEASGAGSVSVTAPVGCTWAVSSSVNWLTVSSGASGTGNGTVTYLVAANTSINGRIGTIAIDGQTLTVMQSGVLCSVSI